MSILEDSNVFEEKAFYMPLTDEELILLGEFMSDFIFDKSFNGSNIQEKLIKYAEKSKEYSSEEVGMCKAYYLTTDSKFEDKEFLAVSKITRNFLKALGVNAIASYLNWILDVTPQGETEEKAYITSAKYFAENFEEYLNLVSLYYKETTNSMYNTNVSTSFDSSIVVEEEIINNPPQDIVIDV